MAILSSEKEAVDAAQSIFRGQRAQEKRRLDRIARALAPNDVFVDPVRPSYAARGMFPVDDIGVNVPPDATPVMRSLARKARTNYLALVVDAFAESLFVEGYRPATVDENAAPWQSWQANGWDARQAGVHRHAIAFGVSYGVVLPGKPKPVMRPKSPRTLTAVYDDPIDDDWPELGLEVCGQNVWKLYDEVNVWNIGTVTDPGKVTTEEHGLGVCPVVRYRDRILLEGDPMGLVEQLIPVQARIDETTFGLLIAQYFAAFKQRYIIGWVPQTEEEQLRASASTVWTFEDGPEAIRIGEFSESDLDKYISSGDAARRDLAAISQLPLHNFAVGTAIANISAEALAAMEYSKERKEAEMRASLGESHEQLLRLSALAEGDTTAAEDYSAQVRWRDTSARSLSQTADALGKLSSQLEIPAEGLWTRIPGVSDQDIAEWKRLRAAEPEPPEPGDPAAVDDPSPQPPMPGMPGPMPPASA